MLGEGWVTVFEPMEIVHRQDFEARLGQFINTGSRFLLPKFGL